MPLEIRDIARLDDLRAVEALQKEVWGWEDLDVLPLTTLIVAKELGGMLLGAFDGAELVGFVFGLFGREGGHLVIHSDMLAVRESYRSRNVGFDLKLAQRERALEQGVARVTWTFDPLQSRNAHLNFAKLGVMSDRYLVNFYGESTSSFLHQGTGTDRLWVTWLIDSARVRRRLAGEGPRVEGVGVALVEVGPENAPVARDARGELPAVVEIQIPADIVALQRESLEAAAAWRAATREAFTRALGAGFVVRDFRRPQGERPGAYILERAAGMEALT